MRKIGSIRKQVTSNFASRRIVSDEMVKCEITPHRIYCNGHTYDRKTGKIISRHGDNYCFKIFPDTLIIE